MCMYVYVCLSVCIPMYTFRSSHPVMVKSNSFEKLTFYENIMTQNSIALLASYFQKLVLCMTRYIFILV